MIYNLFNQDISFNNIINKDIPLFGFDSSKGILYYLDFRSKLSKSLIVSHEDKSHDIF